MKKEELGELIIASEDMMYHVAKTLLYRDADCADAIQETIVKAFSKLHTLKSDVYAKTWLTRILINECYTVMRKEKKVVSLEDYQMEGPADLPEETAAKVQEAALKAYRAAGVEVYGRVDVLLREVDDSPFVLEINTIPGMTPSSLLPKAAAAAGWSYEALCEKIAELSLADRKSVV